MYMYTHTFAVTWMNYDGHINSSRLTLMLIPISLAWLPKSIFGQLELKITWGTKVVGKNMLTLLWRHEFVNYVLWEVMFFCWTLAHETNHNNIGETRNKPASQIPSFGCVLAKSPSMNDHCCPSRSTASWEAKVEVPNLGKISLVVDVVGLFLRTMSMCKYKHEYIYIYYYMKCVYNIYIYILCLCTIDVVIYLFTYIMKGASFMMAQWLYTTRRTRNFTSF